MIINPLKVEFRTSRSLFFAIKRALFSTNLSNAEKIAPETKLLKVGIIGVPNSGKSTLINSLMDRKVCPTSKKVHTTQSKSMAIFTEEDAQIVFLDTPGLVNENEQKKYKLDNSYIKDSNNALKEADIIGVVHDVSITHTREVLNIKVIKLLENYTSKPSFLVLNKTDILKSKRKLLDITRLVTDNCIDGKPFAKTRKPTNAANKEIRGWPYFKNVFMVSALTGDGLAEIKTHLINNALPGQWMYPEDKWTDQSSEDIIKSSVKAQLLNYLPQEIPYILKPEIELLGTNEKGVISAVVIVKSPTLRYSKLAAGVGNGRLRQIIQSVQEDLQNSFQCHVRINIVMDPPTGYE